MGAGDNGERRVSYWLIPAEPDKSHFSRIISDLAQRFDGPIFEPHVTLYSGRAEEADDVEDILARATAGISELVLRTAGLGHSSEFTKTLFVRLEPGEPIVQLSSGIRSRLSATDGYLLNPHLSLLYAPLSREMRDRLVEEIRVPEMIRFDAVHASRTGTRTEAKADVERWRLLAARRLRFAR